MKTVKKEYKLSPQLLLPWHPGRTITCERAAKHLGCSESTIRRMVQDGTLEAFKLRKTRANSPFRIIYDSVVRIAEEWRQEVQAGRASDSPHQAGAPLVPPEPS